MDDSLMHHVAAIALAEEHLPELPETEGYFTTLCAARTLLDMVARSALRRGDMVISEHAGKAVVHVQSAASSL